MEKQIEKRSFDNGSIVLLIIGLALIFVACAKASSIPIEANKDFQRLHKDQKLDWSTKESEYIYVQGSTNRRLLQNFYFGSLGLICVSSSFFRSALNSKNEQQSDK